MEKKIFFKVILPDKIYINDKEANEIKKQYYFDNSGDKINNFTLIWNEEISSIAYMFYGCQNIIEIDFSNFNTSLVKDMSFIFRNCKSLTSLNFSNFDTSKVTDMTCMFDECSKLFSLNLSTFDTSQVLSFDSMFAGCYALISLNLTNFNTVYARYVFRLFIFKIIRFIKF